MKKVIVSAFLLLGALCGVYILWTRQSHDTSSHHTQSPRIAIIGAGLAGLRTALDLQNSGFDSVTVYEARQHRIGGRVMTCMMIDAEGNQRYAELGAENFFDAGYAPESRALVAQMGLELYESHNPDIEVQYFDGQKIIDIPSAVATYGFSQETLLQELEKIARTAPDITTVLQTLFHDNTALQSYFNIRLACFEGGQSTQLSSWYINSLYTFLLDKMPTHVPDLHDREFRDCLCVKGGNSRLVYAMADKLGDNIILNHQLTALEKNDANEYLLTFAHGATVTADIVVLTMPCSVYGDIKIAANVIPHDTLHIIKSVQYGKNSKIITPVTQTIPEVYCNDHVILYQAKQSNVLSTFYCDDRSYFTDESVAAIYAHTMPFIRNVTHITAHIAQPTIAADRDMQPCTSTVGYSWMVDRFAKGSYSFIAPGQEEALMAMTEIADEPVRTAFAPLNNNTVFFAGEHATVFLDTLGTMEAAIESGTRTARMIAKLHAQSTA